MQYYAICKPLNARYKCTYRRALVIITTLWTIALVATIPVLFGTELAEAVYIDDSVVSVCITKANTAWQKTYYIGSMVTFFWIPLIVLVVVYSIIIKRLIRDDRRLLVANAHSTLTTTTGTANIRSTLACVSAATAAISKESSVWPVILWRHRESASGPAPTPPAPATTPTGRAAVSAEKAQARSRRQVVFMLAAVIICFFTCLLPFRVFTLWLLFTSDEGIRALSMERFYNLLYFCRILLYVNSMLNPLLYAVVSSKFRNAFVETVCQFCCYYNDYLCCACTEQDDLDFGKGMGPRGKMRRKYRRNRRFLLRQSTFNTTTTTTTLSSLKNSSLHSNNLESYQARFSSMDSILASRPKLYLQSQQHSFDLDMSTSSSCHKPRPSLPLNLSLDHETPETENLVSPTQISAGNGGGRCLSTSDSLNTISQYSAEYRRANMLKRSNRVAIIDEDETRRKRSTANSSREEPAESSEADSDPMEAECSRKESVEEPAESTIPNIEQILNDPHLSTYESYV